MATGSSTAPTAPTLNSRTTISTNLDNRCDGVDGKLIQINGFAIIELAPHFFDVSMIAGLPENVD